MDDNNRTPFMYGVMRPDGAPHFSEHCVAPRDYDLDIDELDEGYTIVPLYLTAVVPEGSVVVPAVADRNMQSAASKLFARNPKATPADYYRAMVAAARHEKGAPQ